MYLAGGAVLSGFNLQGGGTRAAGDAVQEQSGGGVWCETVDATVTNCNLTRNAANFGGGGVYSGTLIQCTFNGNASQTKGGGAYGSTLNQCTLINNSSQAEGGGACRSILNQCNLYYNSSQTEGGGAYGSALSHCTLNGNEAQDMVAHPHEKYYWHYVGAGGGVSSSRLNSCTLIANTAATGGGANASTLTNCTLTGNAASVSGGGVQGTFVTKCVFIGNTAPTNGNYDTSTLDHSCVAPLPASGTGNFTNAPLFVKTSVGDFHLQSNSPCLNAGLNTAAPGATDLDGRSRIVGGTVDVGAYEFQDATSNQSTAWLGQHGLPVDASSDTADPDGGRHEMKPREKETGSLRGHRDCVQLWVDASPTFARGASWPRFFWQIPPRISHKSL